MDFINQVLELTNQFRAQNGLSPLQLNQELSAAAQDYSQDMAQQDFFSHTGKDGSQPWDRAREVGYEARAIGENLAAGQRTPAEVVQGWIDSPGHRANLLNSQYTEIGIGYYLLENDTGSVNYNRYWTQLFGSGDLNPATTLGETPAGIPAKSTLPSKSAPVTLTEIKGTAGRDQLSGTSLDEKLFGYGGNDVIRGSGGNDVIEAGAGYDWMDGGDGDDILRGARIRTAGHSERDLFNGGAGADQFILGDETAAYYDDGIDNTWGLGDYAFIQDFNRSEGDTVQLHGQAADYRLGAVSGNGQRMVGIFKQTAGSDELIAAVQNAPSFDLATDATFVG